MKKRKFLSLLLAVAMVALSFGAMGVGAAPTGRPDMTLDRHNEIIHLSGVMPTGTNTADGAFLQYALRVGATPTDAELGRVRWMPTYSGAIDISRFIPRRPGVANFNIAFRWSNQAPTAANATVVALNHRPAVGRTDVIYDFVSQQVVVNTSTPRIANGPFEVRIGDDVWYNFSDRSGWGRPVALHSPFPLPLRVMPTGGVIQARVAPTDTSFASMPIRVRIPRPTAPIRAILQIRRTGNNPAFIQGLTTHMEVLVGGNNWAPIPVRNMTVTAFNALNPVRDTSNPDLYTFTLRTRATDTRPASEATTHSFSRVAFQDALATTTP